MIVRFYLDSHAISIVAEHLAYIEKVEVRFLYGVPHECILMVESSPDKTMTKVRFLPLVHVIS